LRAAGTVEEIDEPPRRTSSLLANVVMPALAQAEQAFSSALGGISIEQLTRNAEGMRQGAA
jgi:hypothetical protein